MSTNAPKAQQPQDYPWNPRRIRAGFRRVRRVGRRKNRHYEFNGQQAGETVKLVLRKHIWFLIIPAMPVIGSIIALIAVTSLSATYPQVDSLWTVLQIVFGILIVVTLFLFLYKDLALWWVEISIITNKRAIVWKGFSSPERKEANLEQVVQIATDQRSLLSLLLSYGDVHLYLIGGRGVAMEKVSNPKKVRDLFIKVFDEIKQSKNAQSLEVEEIPQTGLEEALTLRFVVGRINDYLLWILVVLDVTLLIEFFLKLIGAAQDNLFVGFIYALTVIPLYPFNGIVPSTKLGTGGAVIAWSTLIAMAVYFLVFYALRRFLYIIISSSEASPGVNMVEASVIRSAINNTSYINYQQLGKAIIHRIGATDERLIESSSLVGNTVWEILLPKIGLRLDTGKAILYLRITAQNNTYFKHLLEIQNATRADFLLLVDYLNIGMPTPPIDSGIVWLKPENLKEMVDTPRDEWELRPGLPWQPLLEQQIGQIKSAAVFVGKDGMGPWQQMELYALLNEFVNRGCPVIPILLPDTPKEPELPIFLKGRTWVDFRMLQPDPMERLIWGITGKHGHII